MEGDSIYRKAIELSVNEKLLNQSKKNLLDPLNLEVELSLREITKEVKDRFGLPQLVAITTTVSINIDRTESDSPISFPDLELQFTIEGRNYWFEEYIINIIRVYDEAKLRDNWRSRVTLLHLHRDRDKGKNYFYEFVEIPTSIRKFSALGLVTLFTDIYLTQQLLDGRIETILLWIKARLMQYLMAPIRKTNYNIRLIIFAYRKQDGLFGRLPLDIIKVLCRSVLSDLFKHTAINV